MTNEEIRRLAYMYARDFYTMSPNYRNATHLADVVELALRDALYNQQRISLPLNCEAL